MVALAVASFQNVPDAWAPNYRNVAVIGADIGLQLAHPSKRLGKQRQFIPPRLARSAKYLGQSWLAVARDFSEFPKRTVQLFQTPCDIFN
jgi:hypothetical protein